MYTYKGFLAHILMRIFALLPMKNRIVFCSNFGRFANDSPRSIYDEIYKRNCNIECIWLMRNSNIEIPGAKVVKYNSIKGLYALATSKIWIDSSIKFEWIYKRKKQFYIETWHGDVCLKKIELDAKDNLSIRYIRSSIKNSKLADLMISGSKFRTNNYRSAFNYKGEILELGTPKSDILYMESLTISDKVKKYFNLDKDVQIVLYLPTFRNDGNLDCYNLDYYNLLETLESTWPGKWVLILKLHPNIKNKQGTLSYSNCVINGSNYNNTDELIMACDLIITDYSGVMFQALEANKKVLLYCSDLKHYVKEDRGMYFDIEKLPFPLAINQDELTKQIKTFNQCEYKEKTLKFKKSLGYFNDEFSSKRVVDYLIEKFNI